MYTYFFSIASLSNALVFPRELLLLIFSLLVFMLLYCYRNTYYALVY